MRKIIGIVIASMVFANIAFAEMKRIEEEKFSYLGYHLSTVCVDRYKFVVATVVATGSISAVQFYEAGNNQSPKPAKC